MFIDHQGHSAEVFDDGIGQCVHDARHHGADDDILYLAGIQSKTLEVSTGVETQLIRCSGHVTGQTKAAHLFVVFVHPEYDVGIPNVNQQKHSIPPQKKLL